LPSICLSLGFVDSKFIYSTLGNSILCTCPNQYNVCSLITDFSDLPSVTQYKKIQ
jgi:hypothetical protein